MAVRCICSASASNSDTFGCTRSCVIGLAAQKKVQIKSMGHWSTTQDMGTVLQTWPNGRFVQIQEGFSSKETLVTTKGAHFP